MTSNIRISIIIPVKNGSNTIEKCLKSIFSQCSISETEVIIVDSGSQDDSLSKIKKYPVKLVEIEPKAFNHGATRNFALRYASGKYVVYTVQDAIPTDSKWLHNLILPFEDLDVMAVCGQQIVPHHKDKNPALWHRPHSSPQLIKYGFKEQRDFRKLSPLKKREICGFDNVNSAYRKETLLQNPFPTVNFSEDLAWAKIAIEKGLFIAYNNNAKVYHYHHESFRSRFKRIIIESYWEYLLFDLRNTSWLRFKRILQSFKLVMISDIPVLQRMGWIVYNMKVYLASFFAQLIFYFFTIFKKQGADFIFRRFSKSIPIGSVKHGKPKIDILNNSYNE